MTVWTAVGVALLASIGVAAVLMMLVDRAHKAIDQMKLDPERL